MNRIVLLRLPTLVASTLAVASWSAQAQTQPKPATQPATPTPPAVAQGGVNQAPWFLNPQVQRQLNFNNAQMNGMTKAYQDAWQSYQKTVNSIDPKLSPAQRQERLYELRQNFYNDFSSAPDGFLKDPNQRQRYDQLHWQYRGYGAFSDPFVANRMKLTPAQVEKIGAYQNDWATEMNKLGALYRKNPTGVEGQFTKLQAQHSAQILSVLTPAQRQAWQQMTGTSYSFGPDAYFPSSTTPPSKQ
jgi:hypothetical protein